MEAGHSERAKSSMRCLEGLTQTKILPVEKRGGLDPIQGGPYKGKSSVWARSVVTKQVQTYGAITDGHEKRGGWPPRRAHALEIS